MSNGGTSAFIHVLVLEGSALARTEREKDIVTWLGTLNQTIAGAGTVGFDLKDIPWSESDFHKEKTFLLRIIDSGVSRTRWEKLSYQPALDRVVASLVQFREMINSFGARDIDPESLSDWSKIRPGEFRKCVIHGVYLMAWTDHGFDGHSCILCTDQ